MLCNQKIKQYKIDQEKVPSSNLMLLLYQNKKFLLRLIYKSESQRTTAIKNYKKVLES